MKVKNVMAPHAKAIWLTESLADAAKSMWDYDCGILPVIKDGRKVVGLITDRDICMAMAIRDCSPASVSVEEVMSRQVFSVTPEDDIHAALEVMKEHKIRRLPVVDAEGELTGILSMNDLVRNAKEASGKKTPQLTFGDVVTTYKAICEHSMPMPTTTTSAGAK